MLRDIRIVVAPLVVILTFCLEAQGMHFRRADTDFDAEVTMADAVKTLRVLFLMGPRPDCDDSMDANDTGDVDLSDAVHTLRYLFLDGPAPPAPFTECGEDPTDDNLTCTYYPGCSECFGSRDLVRIVEENLPPRFCVPADAAVFDVGVARITVCPLATAAACTEDLLPGCPGELSQTEASINASEERAAIRLEGEIESLDVQVESGLAGDFTCQANATFKGTALVPFESSPAGEQSRRITKILPVTIENVEVTFTTTGSELCGLLETQQDLILEQIAGQFEQAANDLVDDIRGDLIGQILCDK